MPVTSDTYANNESQIYYALLSAGLNTAAACGVLANLQLESGFNPINLQDGFEITLRMDDSSYTKAVNEGSYKNFEYDKAGYGIAQWTYSTRKRALYQFAKLTKKTSIGNLDMQIEFLIRELKGTTWYSDFKKVWSMLEAIDNTAQGAYDAGYNFCKDFENPSGGVLVYEYRAKLARDTYWAHYSSGATSSSKPVTNLGQKIVEIARSAKGLDYIEGSNMYDSDKKGADAPGFIYYCYAEAGMDIGQTNVQGYYDAYKDIAKKVSISDVRAADLLFYENNKNIKGLDHIALATGTGSRIYAKSKEGIVEESGLDSPTYILRILSDSETSQTSYDSSEGSNEGYSSISPDAYISLTSSDPNSMTITSNLSRVKTEGYDYGYLIDMTHGGEFKFYIPEFSEQAGAQWNTIEIRGRSVSVHSYNSTTSRSITVSLELYAGVGLYTATSGESGEDTVSRLHRDAYFLKSLEYPDYTNVITRPPSTVHLILGSAIDLVGVVSNVVVEHMKPLDSQNRAMYLKVNFTVTQTAVNPPDWRDIRRGQTTIASTEDISSLYEGGVVDTTSSSEPTNAPVYSPKVPVYQKATREVK